jgi:hypothetical protein
MVAARCPIGALAQALDITTHQHPMPGCYRSGIRARKRQGSRFPGRQTRGRKVSSVRYRRPVSLTGSRVAMTPIGPGVLAPGSLPPSSPQAALRPSTVLLHLHTRAWGSPHLDEPKSPSLFPYREMCTACISRRTNNMG